MKVIVDQIIVIKYKDLENGGEILVLLKAKIKFNSRTLIQMID